MIDKLTITIGQNTRASFNGDTVTTENEFRQIRKDIVDQLDCGKVIELNLEKRGVYYLRLSKGEVRRPELIEYNDDVSVISLFNSKKKEIGYIQFSMKDKNALFVYYVVIDREEQGKRLFEKLSKILYEYAKAKGKKIAITFVDENNHPSMRTITSTKDLFRNETYETHEEFDPLADKQKITIFLNRTRQEQL